MKWKKCADDRFPDYEISDTGLVRRNGKILKPSISKRDGYVSVGLYHHCFHKTIKVHRLVALAFIPTNDTKLDVNHKDGNKQNNSVSNLEWCTRSENHRHAFRLGLKKITDYQMEVARRTGKNTKNLKKRMPVACYKNGELLKTFNCITDAYLWLGAGFSGLISACCKGNKKTYKGFEWRYI